MVFDLTKSFRFEAAHWLPNIPFTHKCSRLHGHSYCVTVSVKGEVDDTTGMVIDFGEIFAIVSPLAQSLDHRCLNMIDGLYNPTSELLAKWFWDKLHQQIPQLSVITISETCSSSASYRAEQT